MLSPVPMLRSASTHVAAVTSHRPWRTRLRTASSMSGACFSSI